MESEQQLGFDYYTPQGPQGPTGAVGASYSYGYPKGMNGPSGPIPPHRVEDTFDPPKDDVNHPEHYTLGGIEVYDFIKAWQLSFAEGNVIKYTVRSPYKKSRLKDLKKARWYLDKLIEEAEADAH